MPDFFKRRQNENQLSEYESLLAELERLLVELKADVENLRASLYESESRLVGLLENQSEDLGQKKIEEDISKLLEQWKKTSDEKNLDPGNRQLAEELKYIEDDLSRTMDEKLGNQGIANDEIRNTRQDIESDRKRLARSLKLLEEWERDSEEILKDRERLTKEIQRFKQRYESPN